VSTTYILSIFAIATVIVFRPLLVGVAKALVLVVKPRQTLEQRKARAAMRQRAVVR
jgi:hypothetical protein